MVYELAGQPVGLSALPVKEQEKARTLPQARWRRSAGWLGLREPTDLMGAVGKHEGRTGLDILPGGRQVGRMRGVL